MNSLETSRKDSLETRLIVLCIVSGGLFIFAVLAASATESKNIVNCQPLTTWLAFFCLIGMVTSGSALILFVLFFIHVFRAGWKALGHK